MKQLDPIKVFMHSKTGIAVAEQCANEPDKYNISRPEFFGLPDNMTIKEMKEVFERFGFNFWIEWKDKGIRHSVNIKDLDLSKDKGVKS